MNALSDPTPMALTLGVWLCTLPFLLLLLGPFFGWKVAALATGGLLLVLAVVCRGVCTARAGTPLRSGQ